MSPRDAHAASMSFWGVGESENLYFRASESFVLLWRFSVWLRFVSGDLLSLWSSFGWNVEVEFRNDETVVCPAVGAAHGLGEPHVSSVACPDDDIVNGMPVLRVRGIHDVLLRVGRRNMVLARSCVAHVFSRR